MIRLAPCRAAALLASCCVAAAAPLSEAAESPLGVDPQDGPNVEISISIEDSEVRFQLITNLAFLDEMCEVFREVEEQLVGPEVEDARAQLFELFSEANTVRIDGVEVSPVDEGFELDPGDPSLVPLLPRFGPLAVFNTRLTLVYPCKQPPRQVAVEWGVFPPNRTLEEPGVEPVLLEPVCTLKGAGLQSIVRFRADEPEFVWHRPSEGESHLAPVPEVSAAPEAPFPWAWAGSAALALVLALVGPRPTRRVAGVATVGLAAFTALRASEGPPVELPDEAQALRVFESLHANIYRAFDYTAPDDVYDALAESVDGTLLDRLYDEIYRSLIMQEENGAMSVVEAIRYSSREIQEVGLVGVEEAGVPLELPGFQVDATWQIDGVVRHGQHSHSRTNEYRAHYTVAATEAGWRITDSRVLEQRRLDAAPLPLEDEVAPSQESADEGL